MSRIAPRKGPTNVTLIHVPRPPKTAMNPDRPVSSLLRNQIEHLHGAEQRLPVRFRSKIYINAIKTQAEAARYCREVTEAIQHAHAEAAAARAGRVVDLAAAAPEPMVSNPKASKRSRAEKNPASPRVKKKAANSPGDDGKRR